MNTRTTGIIGRASAVCINEWKWAGPLIDTTDLRPLSSKFGVPPLLVSGAIAFQRIYQRSDNRMYCQTPFPVPSLKQLLVRFLQDWEAP